ncbi:MAG: N-acetyltransferase [Gemmatimonadaceae bacterium]|nr:N-acetyltransferase [Gemmatimonadaceae bacterium]
MTNIPDATHDAAASVFQIDTAHGKALLRYVERNGVLDLVHTEVPEVLEGQGYGSALARAALSHARKEGKKIIPSCPFVTAYLKRHPADAALVVRG